MNDKISRYENANLPFTLKLLEQLNSNNFNFSTIELIDLINQLDFLNLDRISEILIHLHFNDKNQIHKNNFNKNVLDVYGEINTKNNLELTLVKYDFLDSLKWLHYTKTFKDIQTLFLYACKIGKLNICIWIYELNLINIHDNNEYAFGVASTHGKINVAKWIYCLNEDNIYVDGEKIFSETCKNGHLNAVRWLYSLPEIDINIEQSLQKAQLYNRVETIKWLKTVERLEKFLPF